VGVSQSGLPSEAWRLWVDVADVADVMDRAVREKRRFSGEVPEFGASREAPNPSILASREKRRKGSSDRGEAPSGREAPFATVFPPWRFSRDAPGLALLQARSGLLRTSADP
jgi:hypothetical protein